MILSEKLNQQHNHHWGHEDVETPSSGFSPLEWQAIALAQREPLSGLARPGRLALAMGVLFGSNWSAEMADGRLEALRRTSIRLWHGRELTSEDIMDFLSTGFTRNQLLLLLQSIGCRRRDWGRKALAELTSRVKEAASTLHVEW